MSISFDKREWCKIIKNKIKKCGKGMELNEIVEKLKHYTPELLKEAITEALKP